MTIRVLVSNIVFHEKTKHIEIDVPFVREQVVAKKLRVQYVRTSRASSG